MLSERIRNDMVLSMKERNEFMTSTLRMLLAELKNKEIDLKAQGKELTDEESLTVLAKEKKKRQESEEIYGKSGRPDLAEKEGKEVEIIDEYLPKQMTQLEVEEFIKDEVSKLPGSDRNFNNAVKIIMPKLKGKADSRVVVEILKKELDL